MIRQRVTRHGAIHALAPPTDLPGCRMARELVGVVKVGTVRKWLEHKRRWDARFKQAKAAVHKTRLRDLAEGYEVFAAGDVPPPSALAGRRRLGYAAERLKKTTKRGRGAQKGKKAARSLGLSLWALWGSKHDEAAVQRELLAVKAPELVAAGPGQGQGARHFSDLERQEREARLGAAEVPSVAETSKVRAWRGLVGEKGSGDGGDGDAASVPADRDEGLDLRPAGPVGDGDADGADADAGGEAARPQTGGGGGGGGGFLSPDDAHDTGVSGKRVIIGGLATPFSLRKEPETASMITLASPMDRSSFRLSTADSSSFIGGPWGKAADDQAAAGLADGDKLGDGDQGRLTPGLETPFMTPFLSPTSPADRPELDRFVTAEEVAKAGGA